MRVEVIRCDVCKKEHNAEYVLPREWVTLKVGDGFGLDKEFHLCSVACLMEWARRRGKQVTVIEDE